MDTYLEKQLLKYKNKTNDIKIAIFMMGIPGSGKTSILNTFLPNVLGLLLHNININSKLNDYDLDNFVLCNPDEIVKEEPGYSINKHREFLPQAMRLNNKLLNEVLGKYNFIYDATGKQFGHYLKKIKQAQELNYFTILVDVRTTILNCYIRMFQRERKINWKTIERLHQDIYTPKHYPNQTNNYENMNNFDILEEQADLSLVIQNEYMTTITYLKSKEEYIQDDLSDFINLKI